MRKLLNKLLIKFGLLITKAPTLLADHSLETSDSIPADLTEKVTVTAAAATPDNELFCGHQCAQMAPLFRHLCATF